MERKLNIETSIRSLTSLLDDLKNGGLQIPAFQRGFVWERDNIKDLFDSIKNGYPIGSILLWKPNEPHWKSQEIIGSYYIPLNKQNHLYVLDGFQRLSTLLGCLTNPDKSDLNYDQKLRDELFNLYYDLEDEIFIYIRSGVKRLAHQIPIYILLSSSDFRQYSRNHIEPGTDNNKIDIYLDRADKLSRTLLDYKIATIEIRNANIEEAVEIFSRINSKGTEISFDWMVNALSISSNFGFGEEIDKLLDDLYQYNFNTLKRDVIFRCIQSSFGKLYIDQSNIEELARRSDFAEITRYTIPFIKRAVTFLYNDLLVLDSKLLPYNIQLIFIVDFFKKKPDPTDSEINQLKKWFWCTTYANYFTIYSLSNQRKAYEQFHRYLDGKSDSILFNDNPDIKFRVSSFPEKITMGSVRSKALILFLLNRSFNNTNKIKQNINGFFMRKIFSSSNDVSNIIPLLDSEEFARFKGNKDLSIDEIINLNEQLNICIDNIQLDMYINNRKDDFLKLRKEFIIKEESQFIYKLGLDSN